MKKSPQAVFIGPKNIRRKPQREVLRDALQKLSHHETVKRSQRGRRERKSRKSTKDTWGDDRRVAVQTVRNDQGEPFHTRVAVVKKRKRVKNRGAMRIDR